MSPLIAISFKWFLQKQRTYYCMHTFYKLIFRIMYVTGKYIFKILSLSVFPPFRIPFIVSLRYSENINAIFSSRTWTAKKKNLFHSLLFHSGTPYYNQNLYCLKVCVLQIFMLNPMLSKLPARFCPLAERLDTCQGRYRT